MGHNSQWLANSASSRQTAAYTVDFEEHEESVKECISAWHGRLTCQSVEAWDGLPQLFTADSIERPNFPFAWMNWTPARGYVKQLPWRMYLWPTSLTRPCKLSLINNPSCIPSPSHHHLRPPLVAPNGHEVLLRRGIRCGHDHISRPLRFLRGSGRAAGGSSTSLVVPGDLLLARAVQSDERLDDLRQVP